MIDVTAQPGLLPARSASAHPSLRSRLAGSSARRRLQVALGLLWLLDALLQLQPYMFTTDFPREVIAPSGDGSPGWVQQPVTWAADLLAGHIVVLNSLAALTQLAIAVAVLHPRTVRWGLAASVVWSLSVWWLGEGLGGLFAGPVSPLSGAPGAVLLYVLVAVLVWPARRTGDGRPSVAEAGPLGPVAARLLWLALWAGLAVEALLPADRSPSALHDLVAGGADGEPGWLAAVNSWAARLLDHHGTQASLGLGLLLALVAVGVLVRRARRPVLVLAAVLGLVIWVVGQDFGALATGQATDPNSGLLLVLLAATFWPVAGRRARGREGRRS